MSPSIVIAQGPEKGVAFPLHSENTVLGRDLACDMVLTDEQVSRRHLRLFFREGTWWVEDLHSSNGTLLNGRQLSEERLDDGDILLLGETMMGFHIDNNDWSVKTAGDTQTISIDEPGILQDWDEEEEPEVRQRARHDLKALYRVGRHVNGILKTSQLLPAVLDMVFGEIERVHRASVFLFDPIADSFSCAASRERQGASGTDPEIFNETMARQVLKEKAAVLTYDALTDERFAGDREVIRRSIRAAICVPLQSKDRILGVIYADSSTPRLRFTRDDLRLLGAIGLHSGTALENAQLYERLAYDKAALHVANQQLKTTQDQLVQSEKLAAVGRLASGIVHDMKNPMTVILGYTGLIRRKLKKEAPGVLESTGVDALLTDIDGGVEHVNAVISQLLTFARPSVGKRAPVRVEELLRETIDFLKHETTHAGIAVEYDLPSNLPPVEANANQLKQVFINIILNAVQATIAHHGKLIISAENAHLDGREMVAIQIKDNGSGIEPEKLDRIFEPFYTTKKSTDGPGGSGLGLSMSYGIIRSHGGSIAVQSELGQGTAFRIMLPVSTDPPGEA